MKSPKWCCESEQLDCTRVTRGKAKQADGKGVYVCHCQDGDQGQPQDIKTNRRAHNSRITFDASTNAGTVVPLTFDPAPVLLPPSPLINSNPHSISLPPHTSVSPPFFLHHRTRSTPSPSSGTQRRSRCACRCGTGPGRRIRQGEDRRLATTSSDWWVGVAMPAKISSAVVSPSRSSKPWAPGFRKGTSPPFCSPLSPTLCDLVTKQCSADSW